MKIIPSFFYVDNTRLLGKPINGSEMLALNYEAIPANWEGFSSMKEATDYCDKWLALIAENE